jgi:hypothetical protein
MRRFGLTILAALLVLGGGWLCIPRPSHLFDTLQSSCRLSDGAIVRLYEGDGGATTALSYSVTVQIERWPWRERTVFYSYGEPAVASVTCSAGTLTIIGTRGDWSISQVTGVSRVLSHETWALSPADLGTDSKTIPINYHRGAPAPDLVHHGNWGPIEILRTVIGGWISTAGLLLFWLSRRRLPNKPLERPGANAPRPTEGASAGRSASR